MDATPTEAPIYTGPNACPDCGGYGYLIWTEFTGVNNSVILNVKHGCDRCQGTGALPAT